LSEILGAVTDTFAGSILIVEAPQLSVISEDVISIVEAPTVNVIFCCEDN
jgi:hypothetical protein